MIILQQSRGHLSSGDQLALDLPFAATKSLNPRIGPRPTFTRASAATFVGSDGLIQTAATGVERFDHNPLTPFDCKGLLIEESRTNLIFPSDTLTTQTRTVTATSTTLSFYGTGTVVLSGAYSATVVGSGAYPARRTLTFTPTAGSLTLTVTGSVQYAQLEAGSFATSYIPTTTASAVRSADVCSITGTDATTAWNPAEGTLFSSGTSFGTQNSFYHFFQAGGSSPATSLSLSNYGQTTALIQKDTPESYKAERSGLLFGSGRKMAYGYASGSTSVSYANNLIMTPTTNNATPSVSLVRFGIGGTGTGTVILNGHIATIRYYRRRLSNAKLQALTV